MARDSAKRRRLKIQKACGFFPAIVARSVAGPAQHVSQV
jgi:hypothetical protein